MTSEIENPPGLDGESTIFYVVPQTGEVIAEFGRKDGMKTRVENSASVGNLLLLHILRALMEPKTVVILGGSEGASNGGVLNG